jgi:hypothetical protein
MAEPSALASGNESWTAGVLGGQTGISPVRTRSDDERDTDQITPPPGGGTARADCSGPGCLRVQLLELRLVEQAGNSVESVLEFLRRSHVDEHFVGLKQLVRLELERHPSGTERR